ncbi:MAG: nucleotidyltransferase domain-containing protein [Rhodocyclaceae bacterium]|nr:nucleotidyltransferase domain-containing protein [Rhodocyclaceae bacterium]
MFQDISEISTKQFIDAGQLWGVLQDAERRGAKYTGSMYWRKTGAAKTEYLIKELNGIEKSLGCRSPDTEHIITEFKRNKAESTERLKALREAMKKQQRVNFALRIGRTPNTVIAVLNALANAGIADHFLVIGTNSLYAYETQAGVYLSGDITATKDFDLLWDSRKHLSLVSKDPDFNTKGLIGILKKVDKTFSVLDDESYRAANSEGYMIDLIKRRPASFFDDHEKQQLRKVEDDFWACKIVNMDWLLSAPKFKQLVVGVNGHMAEMTTTDPRAFVLFKTYLSQKDDRDAIKKPRDLEQAKAVLSLIEERLPHLSFDQIQVFPERVKKLLSSLR